MTERSDNIFKPEQMGGYFAEGWSYPWPGGRTVGVLTLSRVPSVRIEPVPTKYREFGVTAPKVSLVTEYPLPNGENLLALNVHLLNFERWSVKKIARDVKLNEVTGFPESRKTGNTKSEFWNEVLGIEKDLPLDRVFFSGFNPTSARVLNYDKSDHRPILVRLKLQQGIP